MKEVSSPIVLNAVWGLIALVAVLLFALAERRRWCVQRTGGRLHRISAVMIAVCFLFPCVSASDDIFSLSRLVDGHGDSSPASKNSIHLERVLQELENLQLSAAFVFAIALCCMGCVEVSLLRSIPRALPCLVGRGPPSFA